MRPLTALHPVEETCHDFLEARWLLSVAQMGTLLEDDALRTGDPLAYRGGNRRGRLIVATGEDEGRHADLRRVGR